MARITKAILEETIKAQAAEIQKLNNELEKINGSFTECPQNIGVFDDIISIQELTNEIQYLNYDTQYLIDEIQQLKDENHKLTDEVQQSSNENHKLINEAQQLKDENHKLTDEIKQLKNENHKLTDEIQQLTINIQNLITENHNARGAGRKVKLTEQITREILALRAENLSQKVIAEKLGMSIGSINKALQNNGLGTYRQNKK